MPSYEDIPPSPGGIKSSHADKETPDGDDKSKPVICWTGIRLVTSTPLRSHARR